MYFTQWLSGTIHSISRHLLYTNPNLIGRVISKILIEAATSMAAIAKVPCLLFKAIFFSNTDMGHTDVCYALICICIYVE